MPKELILNLDDKHFAQRKKDKAAIKEASKKIRKAIRKLKLAGMNVSLTAGSFTLASGETVVKIDIIQDF